MLNAMCRRTKRRQAEVENLQEAVANAGYETAGYAGYFSSGYGAGALLSPCVLCSWSVHGCFALAGIRSIGCSCNVTFLRARQVLGKTLHLAL